MASLPHGFWHSSKQRAAVEPRCHSADATSMSFFDLSGRTNAGEAVDFASHKGKCVLAVNVARL